MQGTQRRNCRSHEKPSVQSTALDSRRPSQTAPLMANNKYVKTYETNETNLGTLHKRTHLSGRIVKCDLRKTTIERFQI
jgi:hypothetical protein